jgi:hypothetical protein
MTFLVRFADGTDFWIPYSQDLFTTIQFEDFVRSKQPLYPLLINAEQADKEKVLLNRLPITEVQPGDVVLVDLRCYGASWYESIALPDHDFITYVVEYKYTRWLNRAHTKLSAICAIFDEFHKSLDHTFVKQYGSLHQIGRHQLPPNMHIIDKHFILRFPHLLEESKRARLLKAYTS